MHRRKIEREPTSDRKTPAARAIPKTRHARKGQAEPTAAGSPTAELVQLAVERRRRDGTGPGRIDRPLDPYEMILLAQHEWRVGRTMHAKALVEEAFLTYDALAARGTHGTAPSASRRQPRGGDAVISGAPGGRPNR